ncbi:MAG TPA: hypothetical protein VMI94_20145 [Bryobacteraceae bacterium]|nr:hypothetical protein [Bryobacteraceae bacterium]
MTRGKLTRCRNGADLGGIRWLLAGVCISLSCGWSAERLNVTWDGDDLHVAAPQLNFLSGKPLDRLKDGASVIFLTQLTLTTDGFRTSLRQSPDRFVFSYDVWEERFSVTKLGEGQRTASHLSLAAAEAWCLDNVAISASNLPQDRPFWLRFELRAAEPKDEAAVIGESGLNLTRLIEIFSRRPRDQQPQWTAEAGPMRLMDVRRLVGRAARAL